MSLDGRTAFVTGSARGIGRAISIELTKLGLRVAVNGRAETDELKKTVSDIESLGGTAMAVLADVTVPEEAELAVRQVGKELGEIQVLVNNVGDFLLKPLLEVSPREWEYTIASNLHSAFFTSRIAVDGMIRKGWGRIVNIGLAGSDAPGASPKIAPYAIAKTGLWIFTKCLARELAGKGVTVNMVAPGIIDTSVEETSLDVASLVPAGRSGTPQEVARVVSFLVEEASSYITGACINVSGGWESAG
ncbi:MAG: SDR family NAD(P)-dependent oxidoreductase [Candidatus Glassbacteria bacterium]